MMVGVEAIISQGVSHRMQYAATASDDAPASFVQESLPQAFASIPDLRCTQGTRSSMTAILSLAVVAVRANHTSVLTMAEWAAHQARHVRRATTPHHTTVQRLFARRDSADLAAAIVLPAGALHAGGRGRDHLLIVKQNQPSLLADIQPIFAPLTAEERACSGVQTVQPLVFQSAQTVEQGHGRIEERRIRVLSALAT